MAAGSYTVYIIHATIVIALQVALRDLSIPSVIKFFIVGSAAAALRFLLSTMIRKIPLSRGVLGSSNLIIRRNIMTNGNETGRNVNGVGIRELKKGGSRLLYLDNFRIFLIITVILHHTALAYGGSGTWSYMEGATDPISPNFLALFNSVNQAYFMSAFFFLAGFFTPRSYDRKGAGAFLLDRIIRLGIPMMVYILLIRNLNSWMLNTFVRETVFTWRLAYDPDHLWFVQILLVFGFAYAIWRSLRGHIADRIKTPFSESFPPGRTLALSIIILSVLTFLIRIYYPVNRWFLNIQPAHLFHYVFSFSVGTLASRGNWLNHLSSSIGRRWGWIALAMIPAFYGLFIAGGMLKDPGTITLFMGGFHWQAFGYALWDTVMLFAMNIFLLSRFREKHNSTGSMAKSAAGGAFTVYIIHATVLYAFQISMRNIGMPSILKFLVVGGVTVIVCFALSAAIRKIPFMRRVLG
jgi:glucan biosynthesis protein C